MGICMLLPDEVVQGMVLVDLAQFFSRCPLDDNITSVRWSGQVRGEQRKKKVAPVPDGAVKQGNKFDHCCFVSMQLPEGFQHVSVKVFKSGRLQTAGCRDGKMSLLACRGVALAMQRICHDGAPETLFQVRQHQHVGCPRERTACVRKCAHTATMYMHNALSAYAFAHAHVHLYACTCAPASTGNDVL